MDTKRTYFPPTTAPQRRLLFEVWEATGLVAKACYQAHVCTRTFFKWKPRFAAGGYAALAEFQDHAPKNPHRKPQEVAEKVIALRRQHPDWGKKRIADELAKGNNWVPLASPNTVKLTITEVPQKRSERAQASNLIIRRNP